MVFLHGLLGSGEEWNELASSLEDRFFCIQIDLPGHGASAGCSEALYPMPACAQAVITTLDELSITTAGLCGYSMGGRLAFFLLTHFADRFCKVVIESATPGLRTDKEREERIAHDETLAAQLERDGIGPFLIYWYRQPLFASLARDQELIKKVTARRLNNDPHAAARSLRTMGTGAMPDLWPLLKSVTTPLLLVTGDLDDKFTALAREIIDLCPTATHRILIDCGHNGHIEKPHEFHELLISFFA